MLYRKWQSMKSKKKEDFKYTNELIDDIKMLKNYTPELKLDGLNVSMLNEISVVLKNSGFSKEIIPILNKIIKTKNMDTLLMFNNMLTTTKWKYEKEYGIKIIKHISNVDIKYIQKCLELLYVISLDNNTEYKNVWSLIKHKENKKILEELQYIYKGKRSFLYKLKEIFKH